AHYLKGEFADAVTAYRRCLELSRNPDMVVSTTNWLYMSLQRMGRADEARETLSSISSGMDVIENKAYYRLLLFYKGEIGKETLTGKGTDGVTFAYGLASHELYAGSRDKAKRAFKQIVDNQVAQWPAFAYIAAESEIARLPKAERKRLK